VRRRTVKRRAPRRGRREREVEDITGRKSEQVNPWVENYEKLQEMTVGLSN
jgi:hypothetical protein